MRFEDRIGAAKRGLYRENFRRRADLLLAVFMRIGVLVSAFFALATLWIAFCHLAAGLSHARTSVHGAADIIGAVEIFLLSPLPYLVLRSLGNYAEDFFYYQELKPSTKRSLIETKGFMVALLFTMLIANFVGRYIRSTPDASEHRDAPTAAVQANTGGAVASANEKNHAEQLSDESTTSNGDSAATAPQKKDSAVLGAAKTTIVMPIQDAIFACAILLILILFYTRLEQSYIESAKTETDEEFFKRISTNRQ